jgi:hypothetical protein
MGMVRTVQLMTELKEIKEDVARWNNNLILGVLRQLAAWLPCLDVMED